MKKVLYAGVALAALSAILVIAWVLLVLSDLPDVTVLKHYRPAAAAEIMDKDGNSLTAYFDRKFRIWVPISSLSDMVIHAVVTAEDDMFFEHQGVNYTATWEALVHDVQKRRFARGGSTITQQMIKNVLLTREKTVTRKIREYVLARKAEELLTKRQILQIYLNEVEWGENIYGIEAASRFYLDKHASQLSIGEAALLAGMLPNPRYYNPFKRPEKARDRQERVLGNLFQAKLISAEEYEHAVHFFPELRTDGSGSFPVPLLQAADKGSCCRAALEQILLRLFRDQSIYRGGLTIRTTLDRSLQREMERLEDENNNLQDLDRVVLVTQEDSVRAIVCSVERESLVRDAADEAGLLDAGYGVAAVDLNSITREQIILSVQGEIVPGRKK
jgi:penicillin-binding protein 1A